jgi:uncharacterized protein (TIGR03435 family)
MGHMRSVSVLFLLLAPTWALGQAPQAPPAFEVAAIKPAPPLNLDRAAIAAGQLPHIGINIQGSRVDIGFLSLADLLTFAFNIKPSQLSGPEWMKAERFDILAKMPDGATREQVPEMVQALLAERFGLKTHREAREDAVYALVVAKGGHKLKESPPDPELPPGEPAPSGLTLPGGLTLPNGPGQVKIDRGNNAATIVSGRGGTTKVGMAPDGQIRMEMSKTTMEAFAQMLTRLVDRPVLDMTELKGNFQISLDISRETMLNMARAANFNVPLPAGRGGGPGGLAGGLTGPADASDPSGGSIFASVQQLGLRLEPRKLPLEHIVVDQLEKTPTEN